MPDNVWFATKEAGSDSSGYSGFPFPIVAGKKWAGHWASTVAFDTDYDPAISLAARKIIPGWVDGYFPGSNAAWVDTSPDTVTIPSGIPAGVVFPQGANKTSRVILGPGTGYIGPFSREDATRIWWVAKSTYLTASLSGDSSSSVNAYSAEVDETFASAAYKTEPTIPSGLRERDFCVGKAIYYATLFALQEDDENNYDTAPPWESEGAFASIRIEGEFRINGGVAYDIDSVGDYYLPVSISIFGRVYAGAVTHNEGSNLQYKHFTKECHISNQLFPVKKETRTNNSEYVHKYILNEDSLVNFDWFGWPESDAFHTVGQESRSAPVEISVPFNFFGKTLSIPCYRYANHYGETYQEWSYEGAPTSDLTAEVGTLDLDVDWVNLDSYWPYDDGNGNPVWNTSTGAMLRDPVTGLPV